MGLHHGTARGQAADEVHQKKECRGMPAALHLILSCCVSDYMLSDGAHHSLVLAQHLTGLIPSHHVAAPLHCIWSQLLTREARCSLRTSFRRPGRRMLLVSQVRQPWFARGLGRTNCHAHLPVGWHPTGFAVTSPLCHRKLVSLGSSPLRRTAWRMPDTAAVLRYKIHAQRAAVPRHAKLFISRPTRCVRGIPQRSGRSLERTSTSSCGIPRPLALD